MCNLDIWSAGDFSRVAATTPLVGELLCERIGLRAGERVLDVACGSGNTAIAAARRGCTAIGVDIVPALLEHARKRADIERLEVAFELGDTDSLPFPNARFDVVLSTFGAIFSPEPAKAARELLRVLKPGGRLGMANWTRDGFIGCWLACHRRFVPSSLPSPLDWADRVVLEQFWRNNVASLETWKTHHMFRHRSAEAFVDFMCSWYGPTRTVFEALTPESRQHFSTRLTRLARQYGETKNGAWSAPAEYIQLVAVKQGD
jgi:ubiquinone/menaquinone biosynthesis C-methylase UbiE